MSSGRGSVLLVAVAGTILGAAHADVRPPTTHQALDAARRFQASWLVQWKHSERTRHVGDVCSEQGCPLPVAQAMASLHCHRSFTDLAPQRGASAAAARRSMYFIPPERFLPSRRSAFAVCPGWALDVLSARSMPGTDDGLLPELRQSVRAQRDSVLAALEAAMQTDSASDLLIGQRVRFSLDQGGPSQAARVLTSCPASRWWCSALAGLVAYSADSLARSDVLFTAAARAMPDSVRCAWNDLSALLDTIARRSYAKLTCTARDSANARVWWLSDALYVTRGNERRAAHYARMTSLAIHSALGRDERFDWQANTGNDARREMITRFGWPTYTYWGGEEQDAEHDRYLQRFGESPPNGPYTTYEYAADNRVHLVPNAAALSAPFSASDSSWELSARKGEQLWWPREHLQLSAPLVQLAAPQVAVLRRESSSIIAAAVQLPADGAGYRAGEKIGDVALVASPQPDSVIVVAQHDGIAGNTVALFGNVPFGRALIGVEFTSHTPRSSGRVRFGQEIAPPLDRLKPGETAISQPVLLARPTERGAPRLDCIVALMATTATVKRTEPFGVYWETYGFPASDTLTIAIWIERHTPESLLRKVATSLNLVEDQNTPIVIKWTAAPGAPDDLIIEGPVRVVGRQLRIDASHLAAGTYWLDVAAQVRGSPPVRGRREIVVQ
jgi:hypothetical protein